ncbi:hypothetical protein EDB86DRAFT_2977174 [Lactarius hatsudake]|nr:hypothetical protein EDB86DRAFT_2977174 [Lactarius hatsudake]
MGSLHLTLSITFRSCILSIYFRSGPCLATWTRPGIILQWGLGETLEMPYLCRWSQLVLQRSIERVPKWVE